MSLVTLKPLSGSSATTHHHYPSSLNQMHSQFDDMNLCYPNQSKKLKYCVDSFGTQGKESPTSEIELLTETQKMSKIFPFIEP